MANKATDMSTMVAPLKIWDRRNRKFWFSPASIIAGIFLLIAQTTTVAAVEFCVRCDNPPGTYTCAIDQAAGGAPPAGSQFQCISEIARSRGHGTCSVTKRDQGPCGGELVVMSPDAPPAAGIPPTQPADLHPDEMPGLDSDDGNDWGETDVQTTNPDAPIDPDTQMSDPPTQHADQQNNDKPKGEPKTVVELAERTAESSKEGISNAGKAIGSAAKKTWDCISSLFFECW